MDSLSPTRLSIVWEPINCSQQNGDITIYEVRYTVLDTFNGEILDTVRYANASGQQQLVVSGLEEFTQYSVVVRGYTVVGVGPFSAPQTNTTMENGESGCLLYLYQWVSISVGIYISLGIYISGYLYQCMCIYISVCIK